MGWSKAYQLYSNNFFFDEDEIITEEFIKEEFMKDNRWYDAIVEDFSVYTTHISFCIKYCTDEVIQDISNTIFEKYGIKSMYREIPHDKMGYYFEN